MPNAELRESQIEMALAVADALAEPHPLVVEAGTGVGKSLAYLVPLALSKKPSVIVTATKALQDQLLNKEVPQVYAAGIPLRAAVLKGRLNYLCKKKLNDQASHPPLGITGDEVQLRKIASWAETTVAGERDELQFDPSPQVWSSLSMSADECPGADKCPFGDICFAERAKREATKADVVIVNAALYGAHLSTGRTLLPPHDQVVFDEAHELPDIMSRALGVEITVPRIRALAGLARPLSLPPSVPFLEALHRAGDDLEAALFARIGSGDVGVDPVTNEALVSLEEALVGLQRVLEDCAPLPGPLELDRLSVRGVVVHLRSDLSRFLAPTRGDLIFVEGQVRPALVCAPVEVGGLLQSLWSEVTPVLTSATIPDDLTYRLGLVDAVVLELPSPFDYASNSLLYVPTHLDDRRSSTSEEQIAHELATLINAAHGRTLALFTSRRALEEVGARVRKVVATPVLIQGEHSRAVLLDEFASNEQTSLFATMGFWQGVDIPGRTLSLLTIDRLPFGRPDDPMLQARRELAGSSAFATVDLPRTSMLLAQGVGRLIRNAQDRGVVCVFDTRLATAGYRKTLLKRLPPMSRSTSHDEVVKFLKKITSDS
jgi:ATP-dependent DNA helicase DinG